jgi:hypothetical protein
MVRPSMFSETTPDPGLLFALGPIPFLCQEPEIHQKSCALRVHHCRSAAWCAPQTACTQASTSGPGRHWGIAVPRPYPVRHSAPARVLRQGSHRLKPLPVELYIMAAARLVKLSTGRLSSPNERGSTLTCQKVHVSPNGLRTTSIGACQEAGKVVPELFPAPVGRAHVALRARVGGMRLGSLDHGIHQPKERQRVAYGTSHGRA